MEMLPVGPREVLTATWPCAACDARVYRDTASGGYRHVEPLGFVYCPGGRPDPEFRARPRTAQPTERNP